MVPLSYYIILSSTLFTIGAAGVIARRNALIIFLSIELMLNASNIAFVAFARYSNQMSGQIFVFFTITVAAAEVAVGLAILIALFRNKESVDVDEVSLMKW